MNELIPIETIKGKDTVNARELHEFLEVQSRFADWFKNRVEKYDFFKGIDFLSLSKNLENGGRTKEYFVSLEMAKELSMVENNPKGQEARRYFIKCEKKLKDKKKHGRLKDPSTLLESIDTIIATEKLFLSSMIKLREKEVLLIESNEKVEEQALLIEDLTPKAGFYDQVMDSKGELSLRGVAAVIKVKNLGRNKLFAFLRYLKILDRFNIPYQNFQDSGYFHVVLTVIDLKKGKTKSVYVTKVTKKGLEYVIKKIKEHYGRYLKEKEEKKDNDES